MRRRSTAALALAVLLGLSAPATAGQAQAAVAPPSSFTIGGAGFGHGVGMSQYGAYGQAVAGRTTGQILGAYYTGTALTPVSDAADVAVQILGGVSSATASATSLSGGAGGRFSVVGVTRLDGGPGDTVTFAIDPYTASKIQATVSGPGGTRTTRGVVVTMVWQGTRYEPGGATVVDVRAAGGRYRHGRLEVSAIGGRVNVVNRVRLHEEYLDGIAEMPSSWPAEALKAQAIAARTYAIRALAAGVRSSCACVLYDEVTDQKFTGWSKEGEVSGGTSWGARWVAAVAATSPTAGTGLVITRGGAPIEAYYFSSDGGRTENSEDVWSAALPYLRSVPDPWSLQPPNPYRSWSRTVSQAAMAAAFGLHDVARLDLSQRTAGGAVRRAVATSSAGATSVLSGGSLRSRLGLPSTWLNRQVTRVYGADRYATAVAVAAELVPVAGHIAVIVGGDGDTQADGLVAAPLAHELGAPVLPVAQAAVPAAVWTALTARSVTHAVVVGGTSAVGDAVVAELRARGITVERVAGADRYATAAAVARRMGPAAAFALVASGEGSLADPLAAAAAGAAAGRPVLLVTTGSVPAATAAAIADLGIRATTCVGGQAALGEAVRLALPACSRVGGLDRYATSTAVAHAFRGLVSQTPMTVVAGDAPTVVDALSAAAIGRPMLFVATRSVPESIGDYLHSLPAMTPVVAVGGPAVLTPDVVTSLSRM